MAVDYPHFTLPFAWGLSAAGGLAATVCEQESVTEITACAEAVIRTVEGERTSLPDFGRPELEFDTDPEWTRTVLGNALLQWEPRVTALISANPDPSDESVQIVRALLSSEGG